MNPAEPIGPIDLGPDQVPERSISLLETEVLELYAANLSIYIYIYIYVYISILGYHHCCEDFYISGDLDGMILLEMGDSSNHTEDILE